MYLCKKTYIWIYLVSASILQANQIVAIILRANATKLGVICSVCGSTLNAHLSQEINHTVQQSIDNESIVFTNKNSSYVDIADFVELHITEKSDKQTDYQRNIKMGTHYYQ